MCRCMSHTIHVKWLVRVSVRSYVANSESDLVQKCQIGELVFARLTLLSVPAAVIATDKLLTKINLL